ncbi:conserved Plasmodium protein, unknown function [Plasmodium gallinaceum]|uniref:Uncharacterized protein n=1 Tax=Plasmodium gallinaceum TaxID=5849 RepID=A0A1J1H3S7_PLAGA|nr:conserved Plasmodium protein, unknown function [Plasmodium gallinaceum]CRG98002.1 conserved Plasmodium protein, unknown function [Plasmodium gallinaceum]
MDICISHFYNRQVKKNILQDIFYKLENLEHEEFLCFDVNHCGNVLVVCSKTHLYFFHILTGTLLMEYCYYNEEKYKKHISNNIDNKLNGNICTDNTLDNNDNDSIEKNDEVRKNISSSNNDNNITGPRDNDNNLINNLKTENINSVKLIGDKNYEDDKTNENLVEQNNLDYNILDKNVSEFFHNSMLENNSSVKDHNIKLNCKRKNTLSKGNKLRRVKKRSKYSQKNVNKNLDNTNNTKNKNNEVNNKKYVEDNFLDENKYIRKVQFIKSDKYILCVSKRYLNIYQIFESPITRIIYIDLMFLCVGIETIISDYLFFPCFFSEYFYFLYKKNEDKKPEDINNKLNNDIKLVNNTEEGVNKTDENLEFSKVHGEIKSGEKNCRKLMGHLDLFKSYYNLYMSLDFKRNRNFEICEVKFINLKKKKYIDNNGKKKKSMYIIDLIICVKEQIPYISRIYIKKEKDKLIDLNKEYMNDYVVDINHTFPLITIEQMSSTFQDNVKEKSFNTKKDIFYLKNKNKIKKKNPREFSKNSSINKSYMNQKHCESINISHVNNSNNSLNENISLLDNDSNYLNKNYFLSIGENVIDNQSNIEEIEKVIQEKSIENIKKENYEKNDEINDKKMSNQINNIYVEKEEKCEETYKEKKNKICNKDNVELNSKSNIEQNSQNKDEQNSQNKDEQNSQNKDEQNSQNKDEQNSQNKDEQNSQNKDEQNSQNKDEQNSQNKDEQNIENTNRKNEEFIHLNKYYKNYENDRKYTKKLLNTHFPVCLYKKKFKRRVKELPTTLNIYDNLDDLLKKISINKKNIEEKNSIFKQENGYYVFDYSEKEKSNYFTFPEDLLKNITTFKKLNKYMNVDKNKFYMFVGTHSYIFAFEMYYIKNNVPIGENKKKIINFLRKNCIYKQIEDITNEIYNVHSIFFKTIEKNIYNKNIKLKFLFKVYLGISTPLEIIIREKGNILCVRALEKVFLFRINYKYNFCYNLGITNEESFFLDERNSKEMCNDDIIMKMNKNHVKYIDEKELHIISDKAKKRKIYTYSYIDHIFLYYTIHNPIQKEINELCYFSEDIYQSYLLVITLRSGIYTLYIYNLKHMDIQNAVKINISAYKGFKEVKWIKCYDMLVTLSNIGGYLLILKNKYLNNWSFFISDFELIDSNIEVIEEDNEFDRIENVQPKHKNIDDNIWKYIIIYLNLFIKNKVCIKNLIHPSSLFPILYTGYYKNSPRYFFYEYFHEIKNENILNCNFQKRIKKKKKEKINQKISKIKENLDNYLNKKLERKKDEFNKLQIKDNSNCVQLLTNSLTYYLYYKNIINFSI